MAIIEFNWAGYEYQVGLKTVRKSYDRAVDSLQSDIDQSYQDINVYDGIFATEDDPNVEFDEDGHLIHDPRDSLIHASLVAEQAMQALRKAYAIMIYHHWERGARDWGKKEHGGFSVVVKAAQDAGIYVDPEITDLLVLVNALKHNASIWGQPLYDLHPDWFPRTFRRDSKSIEWFDVIQLSSDVMDRLFEIVKRSGPDDLTGFV